MKYKYLQLLKDKGIKTPELFILHDLISLSSRKYIGILSKVETCITYNLMVRDEINEYLNRYKIFDVIMATTWRNIIIRSDANIEDSSSFSTAGLFYSSEKITITKKETLYVQVIDKIYLSVSSFFRNSLFDYFTRFQLPSTIKIQPILQQYINHKIHGHVLLEASKIIIELDNYRNQQYAIETKLNQENIYKVEISLQNHSKSSSLNKDEYMFEILRLTQKIKSVTSHEKFYLEFIIDHSDNLIVLQFKP